MSLDQTSATVGTGDDAGEDQEPPEREPRRAGLRTRRSLTPDTLFWLGMLAAVGLGALVRFLYLFHAAPVLVGGDGFDYYAVSQRLANGLGYTAALGEAGREYAHHPPGWVTTLAAVTELGADSMRAHQVAGLVIGLGVVLIAGVAGLAHAADPDWKAVEPSASACRGPTWP